MPFDISDDDFTALPRHTREALNRIDTAFSVWWADNPTDAHDDNVAVARERVGWWLKATITALQGLMNQFRPQSMLDLELLANATNVVGAPSEWAIPMPTVNDPRTAPTVYERASGFVTWLKLTGPDTSPSLRSRAAQVVRESLTEMGNALALVRAGMKLADPINPNVASEIDRLIPDPFPPAAVAGG